jgi:hypothetical protein
MKACEVAEEKKRTMRGSTEGSSSSAPPSTTWFTHHPRDSHTDLHSSGVTATRSSSSNSSTAALLPLHSSKEQLGHCYRPHQWGTHATTVGRLGTSPRNATCEGRPTHLVLQHLWQITRGASREAQHRGLATPTTPPWMRYPWERKFLCIRSSSMKTLSLYCLIRELHMIS